MGWIDREEDWFEKPPRRPAPAPGDPPAPATPAPDSEPVVRWIPVRCPYCGSRDCPVVGTPQNSIHGMRYHKCRTCDGTFKSFEVNLRPPPPLTT